MTDIVFDRADYARIRAAVAGLHHEALRLHNKSDIHACARHLGLLHKKTLVFEDESELAILSAYQVYGYRPRGFNLAELYLRLNRQSLDEWRLELLKRMSAARFAIMMVIARDGVNALQVTDVLRTQTFTLVDEALSSSLTVNQAMAAHVVDLGGFCIQTGGVVPADRDLLQDDAPMRVLSAIYRKCEGKTFTVDTEDDAKLARAVMTAAIRLGYTERVRYSEDSSGDN